ncbi:MAG TPA: serine dehydratase [Candidatus Aminicenantes bacterium]|nr:serine dehydratase [Candidatus Aminicenantes bacterium]
MNSFPSIFNEVIGPVMRGPSSSHTAASWRIARICLQVLNEPLRAALVEFDKDGAWCANYREQGTAMGIDGGLLGLDIRDDRMKETGLPAREGGVEIKYGISRFPTTHANTVRLTLEGKTGKQVRVQAISTGGGAFEIQRIDDFRAQIRGDYHELLAFYGKGKQAKADEAAGSIIGALKPPLQATVRRMECRGPAGTLLNLKSPEPFPKVPPGWMRIDPVLPIVSGNEKTLPFDSIHAMLQYAERRGLDLGSVGLVYEECRSGLSREALKQSMEQIIAIVDQSICKGLDGTEYKDRILHRQSHRVDEAEQAGVIPATIVNPIIANVSAIMEAKSALEVIVANPTAGSCGTVGGVLKAVSAVLGSTPDQLIHAYFAAGIIGAWFAMGPGFSAEEHGCQVECGAASGMAAAGIVQLMGGTAGQAVAAASMAIQNMIGLICDPVADRVEVPCLGKNISAAVNAFSSAVMARSGFNAVIPLDEVIQTVATVGKQMPGCVKCSGKGGLAVTPSAQRLKDRLENAQTGHKLGTVLDNLTISTHQPARFKKRHLAAQRRCIPPAVVAEEANCQIDRVESISHQFRPSLTVSAPFRSAVP